jgi:hypothetical protein
MWALPFVYELQLFFFFRMSSIDEDCDWQQRQTTIADHLWHMYQNKMETDVNIVLVNGIEDKVKKLQLSVEIPLLFSVFCCIDKFNSKQIYCCHKLVMMRLSPMINEIIHSECESKRIDGEEVTDVNPLILITSSIDPLYLDLIVK